MSEDRLDILKPDCKSGNCQSDNSVPSFRSLRWKRVRSRRGISFILRYIKYIQVLGYYNSLFELDKALDQGKVYGNVAWVGISKLRTLSDTAKRRNDDISEDSWVWNNCLWMLG